MNKCSQLFTLAMFLIATTHVSAAESIPLGHSHLSLKIDKIQFTADELDEGNVDSDIYVGIAGYKEISPNVYFGGEIGHTNPDGVAAFPGVTLESEFTYVPIEANLKYVIEQSQNAVIGLGAGLSYNYLDGDITNLAGPVTVTIDEWLFGLQVFADVNYKFNNYFIGANVKYQYVQESDGVAGFFEINYSNWRLGAQAGLVF